MNWQTDRWSPCRTSNYSSDRGLPLEHEGVSGHDELQRLRRPAVVREYVPTDSYGLLRRIVDRGPQRVRNQHVIHDDTAKYLITRGLAQATQAGLRIENTDAGRLVGLIEWDPLGAGAASGA